MKPVSEKRLLAAADTIVAFAISIGATLDGKVTIRLQRGSYVVRAGRRKLGTLTASQFERGEFDGLFVLRRAIRLELVRPLNETWDEAGSLLRTLAKVTPKLLNAAMDARIACEVAGAPAVKVAVAPDAKAASPEGLAYQAVLREVEGLREWGATKAGEAEQAATVAVAALAKERKTGDADAVDRAEKRVAAATREATDGWGVMFSTLAPPGGMVSAIARAASQAYARRDQQRAKFGSERILVRASETSVGEDERGHWLAIQLRPAGRVRFAVAHSYGTHHETLAAICAGTMAHGDAKLQYDVERKKWYALLAYEAPRPAAVPIDMARVLAVHRGARNALYLLTSTGERGLPFPGSKLLAQRRNLSARMHEIKRSSEFERGSGSKGHGRTSRYESYSALEDKLARVTHTFCQQAAAFVSATAERLGCGLVLIEDYGGIVEPDRDKRRMVEEGVGEVRRVLDVGPLYQIKQCVEHRMEKDGRSLREVPSTFVSSKCPRCEGLDSRAHNTRTGIFHCRACEFERPADWVAAYWMLTLGGADMGVWKERMSRERKFAETLRGKRDAPVDARQLDAE